MELIHSRAFCWCLCIKLGARQPSTSHCTLNPEGKSLAHAGRVLEELGQDPGWGVCGQFLPWGPTGCSPSFQKKAQGPKPGLEVGGEGHRRRAGTGRTRTPGPEQPQLTESLLQACWLQLWRPDSRVPP